MDGSLTADDLWDQANKQTDAALAGIRPAAGPASPRVATADDLWDQANQQADAQIARLQYSHAAGEQIEGVARANISPDEKDAENDPKSEAYWRKRFQTIRDKIDTAQKELDILQRELDKDQVQYYSDPQKALMQQYNRSDINDKTAKIDAKKKEIDGLNQQLTDLEDDLRKAGGDPGWAR